MSDATPPSRSGLARLAAGKALDPGLDPDYLRQMGEDDPDDGPDDYDPDEEIELVELDLLDGLFVDQKTCWDTRKVAPPAPIDAFAEEDDTDDFRYSFRTTL